MEYFYNLLFYFAIYSFAGWCGEVVFATIRHGKFVNVECCTALIVLYTASG